MNINKRESQRYQIFYSRLLGGILVDLERTEGLIVGTRECRAVGMILVSHDGSIEGDIEESTVGI